MNTQRILTLVTLCIFGCSDPAPIERLEPGMPGIRAVPRWLTFTCVDPGCNEGLNARIEVEGNRDVAIKRIVLSDPDRTDFIVEPAKDAPFVLRRTETFDIRVRHEPTGDPREGDVELIVTFTDAAADEGENRLPAGELAIPLVRRLVGEPQLAVSPSMINFGAVPLGETRTADLTLTNEGSGNLGLVFDSIETDFAEAIRIENMPSQALLPDERWNIRVVYQPVVERFVSGFVTVQPFSEGVMTARRGWLTEVPTNG
ncbi:MAG: hypothetical protein AAFN74_11830, partial [Myxococcota bacterium]